MSTDESKARPDWLLRLTAGSRDGGVEGFDLFRIDILVKPSDLATFDGGKHGHVHHEAPTTPRRCLDTMPPDAPISD